MEIQGHYPLTNEYPLGKHSHWTCKDHPEVHLMTKNLAPFGSRGIHVLSETDCACSNKNLRVIPLRELASR